MLWKIIALLAYKKDVNKAIKVRGKTYLIHIEQYVNPLNELEEWKKELIQRWRKYQIIR